MKSVKVEGTRKGIRDFDGFHDVHEPCTAAKEVGKVDIAVNHFAVFVGPFNSFNKVCLKRNEAVFFGEVEFLVSVRVVAFGTCIAEHLTV